MTPEQMAFLGLVDETDLERRERELRDGLAALREAQKRQEGILSGALASITATAAQIPPSAATAVQAIVRESMAGLGESYREAQKDHTKTMTEVLDRTFAEQRGEIERGLKALKAPEVNVPPSEVVIDFAGYGDKVADAIYRGLREAPAPIVNTDNIAKSILTIGAQLVNAIANQPRRVHTFRYDNDGNMTSATSSNA